jgi:hypothetical protein
MFAFSSSVHKAIEILEDFEKHIRTHWGLEIKNSSRGCLVCRGSVELPVNCDRWPCVKVLNVLGHLIQDDGGLSADWRATKASMWGSFWRNCNSKSWGTLSVDHKNRLLDRSVLSKANWKLARWPFQKTIAIEFDATQAAMTRKLLLCARKDGEDADSYDRRRKREARNFCARRGTWSRLWAKRVISWEAHFSRSGSRHVGYPHPCLCIYKFHDSEWLLHQRSEFVNSRCSLTAGRTGTRLNVGRPQVRWEDGFNTARILLDSRVASVQGNNMLSISTIFRETFSTVRNSLRQYVHT